MALFADAGQYADSMARLRECCKQQGISIYYFSEDAVNAGVDTGYAKQDTISGDDKHFGWRLGRFFLTGFTRVTADENQQPVFIKTLGDSVTLWFDLEQDIDALNGNAQLSLAADANGYDQQFGIPKTNFGRGTLIVRHTDYQNAKMNRRFTRIICWRKAQRARIHALCCTKRATTRWRWITRCRTAS